MYFMRVFAHILMLCILLLSAKQSLDVMFTRLETECECGSSCTPISPEKKSTNTPAPKQGAQACNPFQSCGTCVGYTIPENAVFIALLTDTYTERTGYDVQMHPQFSPDFWQPPKIG